MWRSQIYSVVMFPIYCILKCIFILSIVINHRSFALFICILICHEILQFYAFYSIEKNRYLNKDE